jgi:GTPase SAR1 family protein
MQVNILVIGDLNVGKTTFIKKVLNKNIKSKPN